MSVRSVRNNNPGNIKENGTDWQGRVGDDGTFVNFSSPSDGNRAMAKTMLTYQDRHGKNTVREIIGRWAPPNENDTDNYINYVSNRMGISPDEEIDLRQEPEKFAQMISAMTRMEGGPEAEEYFRDSVNDGINRAIGNEILDAESAPDNVGIDVPSEELIAERSQTTGIDSESFSDARNLEEIRRRKEVNNSWWENELDQFENYTYNLELFIGNEDMTVDFLYNRSTNLDDISNDAWPREGEKYITIARNGVSTEFNIQNLEIQSLGTGSSSLSRLAGNARNLSFEIVQVGNTSLADSLQNAALLSGYSKIADATYFVKIRFIGYTPDGVETKLNATKVIPFKINRFTDIPTSTDARGTVTTLTGTVSKDVVFDSSIDINKFDFKFDVKETLQDTLDEYISKLNQKVVDKNFTGNDNLVNTYYVEYDPTIQDFLDSKMTGEEANTSNASNEVGQRTSSGVNISKQIGTVNVGVSIYQVLTDICIQSDKIRNEITANKDTFTLTPHIDANAIPKPKGINVEDGSRGHDVIYTITLKKNYVTQNTPDSVTKVEQTAKFVNDIFDGKRCNKIYYYQYTGRNDQILNFQVSLTHQLTKAFVQPTDEFLYANFLQANSAILDSINDKAKTEIQRIKDEISVLSGERDKSAENLESVRAEFENANEQLQSQFIQHMERQSGQQGAYDEIFKDKSFSEVIAIMEETDSELFRGIYSESENAKIKEIIDNIKKSEQALGTENEEVKRLQDELDGVMNQAIAGLLSQKQSEALGKVRSNFETLVPQSSPNDIILLEELGSDFITRLTQTEFNAVMEALTENAVTFQRIAKANMIGVNKPKVFKNTDQRLVELARQKYYEAQNNDLSMQKLQIQIKGDPFWVESYLTLQRAREIFGEANAVDGYKNYTEELNGPNYVMIVTNKAAGVDEFDNVKIANLAIMVYNVKAVTSSFANGMFTQTLDMVKMPFPQDFKSENLMLTAEEIIEDEPVGSGVSDNPGLGIGVNTTAPGTGNGVSEERSNPEPPTQYYASTNAALMGAFNAMRDADYGVPTARQVRNYINALTQMKSLCQAGVDAACSAVTNMERDFVEIIQKNIGDDANEIANNLNDVHDSDGVDISPELIHLLNQNLDPEIQPIDVGVSQSEYDEFDAEVEELDKSLTIGPKDMTSNPTEVLSTLDTDFGASDLNSALSGTGFVDDGFKARVISSSGRTLDVNVPHNTLTPKEWERALQLEAEMGDIFAKTDPRGDIDDLSEEDYTRLKEIESTLDTMVTATEEDTYRAEIASSSGIERTVVPELQEKEEALEEINDELDGFYLFTDSRKEDEEKREEILQETLALRSKAPSVTITEIAPLRDPSTGEVVNVAIPEFKPVDINKEPIAIITPPEGGNGLASVDLTPPAQPGQEPATGQESLTDNEIHQVNEANNIYNQIVQHATDNRITINDIDGNPVEIPDYSNIGPITYTDANGVTQTIENPKETFGLYTFAADEYYPMYTSEINEVKGKIADFFPDVGTYDPYAKSNNDALTGAVENGSGRAVITMTPNKFGIIAVTPEEDN